MLITFLNTAAALFFGFLMLIPKQDRQFGFTDYIYAPIIFAFKSIFSRSDYFLEFTKGNGVSKSFKIVEIAFGILITLLLSVIILPLLSSANPFFQKIVENIWTFLNLENLLANIGIETVFVWTIRLALFLGFIFFIPKVMTLINNSYNFSLPLQFTPEALPLTIPKLVLAVILGIFFITQLQFYLASDETLKNMGISYSQHTREVFAQLSMVAGIVLLLIHNDRSKSSFGKTLNWILGIQGIFLTLMAYKSVFEYINAWGLTYKRLYGLTFATWITGLFVLQKRSSADSFIKRGIIFSGVILILVNVFNFDYLIYHFKKSKTGRGVDYGYLSTLSADSLSYRDQILKLKEVTKSDDNSKVSYDNKNPFRIINKIESLQNKYSKFDLRTLTLLDFWQYQQIKSLDTKDLRVHYDNKLQQDLY